MDAYDTLRRHARERRNRDIRAARDRYAKTMDQIYKLQAANGQRRDDPAFYGREIRYFATDIPLCELTLVAAAERILLEGRPLSLTELVVELQHRGYRADANPHRLSVSIRSAFRYHRNRFLVDKAYRWSLI